MWLGVNRDGFGKFALPWFAADVKNVAAFRVPFEVNQVDDAFGVHGGLGLDAVVWSSKQTDLWRSIVGSGDRSEEERYKRINQNGLSVSDAFHNRELLIVLPSIAFGQKERRARREHDGFEVAHGFAVVGNNMDVGGLTMMHEGASILLEI